MSGVDPVRRAASGNPDARATKRIVENDEYAAFAARVIRGLRRRACEGDLAALTALGELAIQIEDELLATITELRGGRWAYSWQQIASALRMSRSAAAERFRKAGGVRTPGGQPGVWR